MNTKLSNNIKSLIQIDNFDVEHESKMAQSRILSTILEVVENKNLTQIDLENLTGLKQPFLSGLFNLHKKLNMEHIALFQNALKIKLQPPNYFTEDFHTKQFYLEKNYEPARTHFIDSNDFKDKTFLRWVNLNNFQDNNKNEKYYLIETVTISDFSPSKSKSKSFHEIDEIYK